MARSSSRHRLDGDLGVLSLGDRCALVSPTDFPWASKLRWVWNERLGVVSHKMRLADMVLLGEQCRDTLDRAYLDKPLDVAYLNGDPLDCRRENLQRLPGLHVKKRNVVSGGTNLVARFAVPYAGGVHHALVDRVDYERVRSYGMWYGVSVGGRVVGRVMGKPLMLHEVIGGAGACVLSGNALDCRRQNVVFGEGRERGWHVRKGEAVMRESARRAMHELESDEYARLRFNLGGLVSESFVNGPSSTGREVVWAGGCSRGCLKCFNPELWDFKDRELLVPEEVAHRVLASGADGVTFSGGDCMEQPIAFYRMLRALHLPNGSLHPNLTRGVICFTGFTRVEVLCDEVRAACLPMIDLLIDGRFVQRLRYEHKLAGSSNQRFHFNTKAGRGRVLIGEDEVHTDQGVEVHMDPSGLLQITGFPSDESGDSHRRRLAELGLRILP